MRYYPDDEKELAKELKDYAAEPWMVEQLRRNWNYVNWGPHEDYQWVRDLSDPNSPRKFPTWKAFRTNFTPGELPTDTNDRSGGEIVGWYFSVARERKACVKCGESGLNPESRAISESWYDFDHRGTRWCSDITQDEADKLVEEGRLWDLVTVSSREGLDHLVKEGRITAERAEELWEGRDKSRDQEYTDDNGDVAGTRVHIKWRDTVPAAEVNTWNEGRGFGHDAINRWICVETRCRRLGVWGHCDACDGDGYIPVDLHGRLQLVLWIVNPETGQNYGLEVDNIEEDELPSVFDFLEGMRDRLVARLDTEAMGVTDPSGWVEPGSALSSRSGWGEASTYKSWELFCWPTHYKYGDADQGHRVPKDHPKFEELWKGEPAWGLDDLNELIGVRFEPNPRGPSEGRLHLWIAHPRKGCSRRVTIEEVRAEDMADVKKYIEGGRERAKLRLDPSPETPKEI